MPPWACSGTRWGSSAGETILTVLFEDRGDGVFGSSSMYLMSDNGCKLRELRKLCKLRTERRSCKSSSVDLNALITRI